MKVAILHISDLHFKTSHAEISLLLAEKISSAVSATIVNKLPLIFLCSGDIAFSGQANEYEIFDAFYDKIVETLVKRAKIESAQFIAIPGNHDCDFSGNQDVRNLLLGARDSINKAGILESLLSVQSNFWTYASKKSKGLIPDKPVANYFVCSNGLAFLCFNTAWTSQKHEIQGRLRVLPYDFKNGEGEGFVLSIFHHPYNWLDAEDGFHIKRQVEETSAIAFSGHEHSNDIYVKARLDNGTAYIESGALLENSPFSRFNLAIIDTSNGSTCIYSYLVKSRDKFVSIEKENKIFTGNLKNISNRLAILSKDFRESISRINSFIGGNDHSIENVFIYPNLEKISVKKRKSSPEFIVSDEVINRIITDKRSITLGESNSGKTSLANKLFLDLYQTGYYPIRVAYDEFSNSGSYSAIIEKTVKSQYNDLEAFSYLQIDPTKRFLIIDDLPVAFLNARDTSILKDFLDNFDNVHILTNTSAIESLITTLKSGPLESFTRYKIIGLNPYLRRKFIEKYLDLSKTGSPVEKDRNYYQRVNEIETAINTSLRSNLIPSYPIYIIGIMQYYINSSGKPLTGSNNFVYDLLVKMSIAGISTTDSDYSVYETFLSYLAHKMLKEGIYSLDRDSMVNFTSEYISSFSFRGVLEETSLIATLVNSKILVFDDEYSFKHRHLIYYFAAVYLKNYTTDQEQGKFVASMIDNMSSTPYLNTIAFLIYLNRDYSLVESLMAKAEGILQVLPERKIGDIKKEILQKQKFLGDEIDKILTQKVESVNKIDAESDIVDTVDPDMRKISLVLRLLDLLGEVAKNHVGSWEGAKKSIVVEFCYKSSQKVIGHFNFRFDAILSEVAESEISKLLEKGEMSDSSKLVGMKRADLVSLVNRSVYGIFDLLAVGLVNRVSAAIGTPKMKEVYSDVLKSNPTPEYKLIDATISMNTSQNFPERKILDLSKEFEDEEAFSRMLNYLVRMHFGNFPTKQMIVERVVGALDGRVDSKSILLKAMKSKR